ncbi:helix-turn-helix domain-containing protein [Arachnia propionica]|uniref:Helix-turn-helix domain-containing protein n=1 Tax=Arachnia propionica TaxID=1750 RepID=A0AB37HVP8_9ACTN|nr:helix-turn-helix domain-containing protein [Arachnia propionica]QCT38778.1 helix-turn-helix domain-containing protein [Arachnia propionica]QUC11610.1 helix-turn-helix domain-containing protein [Arachnia propionica]RPA18441.1 DNA-binding protein [Arachnia propionica]
MLRTPTPRFLTLRKATDRGYAGYSTVRKYIADGSLPACKFGRRVRLLESDLEALLTSTRTSSVDAANQKLVATAPPLTPEQTRRLRDLLGEAS